MPKLKANRKSRWFEMKPITLIVLLGLLIIYGFVNRNRPSDIDSPNTIITPTKSNAFTGFPSPVDADTVDLGGYRHRLAGIDAPDRTGPASEYFQSANTVMKTAIKVEWTCTDTGARSRGRIVSQCVFTENGGDVAAWIVEAGYAVDWPEFSGGKYKALEDEARLAKRGMWQTITVSWR